MMNITRCKCAIITIVLLANLMCFPLFTRADDENPDHYQIYNEELTLLKSLGIIDWDFSLDGNVTRGEFVTYVINYDKITDMLVAPETSAFADVTPEHQFFNAIMAAWELKLIYGGEATTFRPDDPITLIEAATILCRYLGYSMYENNYVSKANELGLFRGVDRTGEFTGRDAVIMLSKALTVQSLSLVNTGGDIVLKDIQKKTLLQDQYKLERKTGVITATSLSRKLNNQAKLNKGRIEIDNVEYRLALYDISNNIEDYLGYSVYFYLDISSTSDNDIVIINPSYNRNAEITIDSDHIYDDTTKTKVSYDNGNRSSTASISSEAHFYYNGKETDPEDLIPEDFTPNDGNIRLIDNNSDGVYDYVFIISYTPWLVGAASFGRIGNKYDPSESFDFTDKDIILIRDGAETEASYLGEWDFLKMALDKSRESGIVYISQKEVRGVVSEIIETEGKQFITINDVQYEVSRLYREALAASVSGTMKIDIKLSATFMLNEDNQITGVQAVRGQGMNYMFLINASIANSIDGKLQMRVFMSGGTPSILDVAERVILNGKIVKNSKEVYNALLDENGHFNPQLIMAEINKDNEIIKIDTALKNLVPGGTGYSSDSFSLDWEVWENPMSTKASFACYPPTFYASDSYSRSYTFRVSKDFQMFYVPYDKSAIDDFKYYTTSNVNYANTVCDVQIFDYDEASKEIKVAVIYQREMGASTGTGQPYTNTSISNGAPLLVVDGISNVIDSEGEERLRLNGTQLGGFFHSDSGDHAVKYYIDNKAYNVDLFNAFGFGHLKIEDLKKGDIIQYGWKDGERQDYIDRFKVIATAQLLTDTSQSFIRVDAENPPEDPQLASAHMLCGDIDYIDAIKGMINVNYKIRNGEDRVGFVEVGGLAYYCMRLYDATTKTVSEIPLNYARKGDRCVLVGVGLSITTYNVIIIRDKQY